VATWQLFEYRGQLLISLPVWMIDIAL